MAVSTFGTPMINTQSFVTLWLCGLNLKHHHVHLYVSFQTDSVDTGGRNIIYTFEMQTFKKNAPNLLTLYQL